MKRLALYIFTSALCLCVAGCNVVGALAYKVAPDPTIPAQFIPPKEPTVVLVENFHNPASLRLESDAIARVVSEQLAVNDVAPIIESSTVETFRQSKGPAYRKMPLDAIGQALGARQIIYVDLELFEVEQALASDLLGGKAQARVRIVDDTGEVLWPLDSAGGYPVAVKIEPQRSTAGKNHGAGEQAVRQQLNTALADSVAKLFYNWIGDSADGAQEAFN